MTEVTNDGGTGIAVTDNALRKLGEMADRDGGADLMLRVYIEGGGCSGFQYGFALEDQSEDGDLVMEVDAVKVLVDPMSLQYLTGARLDYREDLQGSRFVIENPNASTTCGCGASFSI